MSNFYAKISAPQTQQTSLWSALAKLTRMSRTEIKVFIAEDAWSNWTS